MTEPFHIFVDYIAGAARLAVKGTGGKEIFSSIASYVVLVKVMKITEIKNMALMIFKKVRRK